MTLYQQLIDSISHNGPISVSSFMAEALLHPRYGYYQQQQPFGKSGDFVTSPEISQVFGELLGIFAALIWNDSTQSHLNNPLQLIELGPGNGTLMDDLLRGTQHIPSFHEQLSLHFVEASDKLRIIQQDRLAKWSIEASWHTTIPTLEPSPSLFIANEFFDALPINQYQLHEGKWYERLIGVDESNQLCFTLSPYTVDAPENGSLSEGAIVETCPQYESIIEAIATQLQRQPGYALIIDYGYNTQSGESTLQAVKDHQYHNVFEDIGSADITAHVDFNAIIKLADAQKLKSFGPIGQGPFLEQLGIHERTLQLVAHTPDNHTESLLLSATKRLTSSTEMGSLFKVLVLASEGLSLPAGITL